MGFIEKLRFGALLSVALVALACDGDLPPPPNPDGGIPPGFDDHTVPRLDTAADYFTMARRINNRAVTKFVVTEFEDTVARGCIFLDSEFYTLHDEWYWFRLLNGEAVPGESQVSPVKIGNGFETVQDIFDWAKNQSMLPLDLRFVTDDRLYSPRFYVLALGDPRVFGVGNIWYVDPRTEPEPMDEIWAFELEYSDEVTHDELVVFFETLESRLAPAAGVLKWLVRSPGQEALAQKMEAEQLRYHDRILRYADLVVPGEIEVYNSGITAGRMLAAPPGETEIPESTSSDILVLAAVPDYLPQAAGLITAVPQTPLAHINILAKNRGIPNAYQGAATDDPWIGQLARVRAPVIIRAVEPDQLDVVAMTEEQYGRYRQLISKAPVGVPQIDTSTAPYFLDLASQSMADIEALRLLIGGKSAGFVGLLNAGVTTPERPLALTIRAYREHLAPLISAVDAMLRTPEFRAQTRLRYLVLEGPARYDGRYPDPTDQQLKDAFLTGHPPGDLVGDLARGGGLAQVIRTQPMSPSTLSTITAELTARFGHYSATQGLRFRSSSTVEDIEGFNGAGLYDSNTGYFDPTILPDPTIQQRTIEWAIKKTWSSYWRFEAFEERRVEAIDHLSGAMGVVVHARFDDDKELSNGVVTLTLLPDNAADELVMEVNLQKGAVSVTNPDPGLNALPEVDRVRRARASQQTTIERVRPSTLANPGEQLLDDADLTALLDQTEAVARSWLANENSRLPAAQAGSTITLDFEIKDMAAGWPALDSGEVRPRTLIIKQARTLDPGLRGFAQSLKSAPIPHDLLARAQAVEQVRCSGSLFELTILDVSTDPFASVDFGYSDAPFVASIQLVALADIPELGIPSGASLLANHLMFDSVATSAPWSIRVDVDPVVAEALGLSAVTVDETGGFVLASPSTELSGDGLSCQSDLLHATPTAYLIDLLASR